MVRSESWTIVVGFDAVSFVRLSCPPPATLAVFVTLDGALFATLTVKVIVELAEAASALLRVQVTVPVLHDHPLPSSAVAVSPVGSVSFIVIDPLVGPA